MSAAFRYYGYATGGRRPPRESEIVRIGNAHGRIAVYLDETEAIDLAYMYGAGDTARDELFAAVERAYPKDEGAPTE